jgi:hypothetical protein
VNIYEVQITTSRNTVFAWEIEDTTMTNVMARIANRLRGLDVISIKIVGA